MGHEIAVRRDAVPRVQQHVDGQHQAQEQGDHHKYGAMLHERTYRANGYDTQPYVVYPAYFRFEFSIYFHTLFRFGAKLQKLIHRYAILGDKDFIFDTHGFVSYLCLQII